MHVNKRDCLELVENICSYQDVIVKALQAGGDLLQASDFASHIEAFQRYDHEPHVICIQRY